MRLPRLSLLAVAAALLVPAAAGPSSARADEIPADAYYTTACLPTVACTGLVEKTSKGRWKFEWSAVDRKTQKTLCRHEATLRLGKAMHRDVELDGVLHGKLDGGRHEVIVMKLDGDQVWMYSEADVCEGVKIPKGIVVLAGNYDMEIGDI